MFAPAFRQLSCLLSKNFLLKRRMFCQSFCELFTPLIMVFLILFGFGLSGPLSVPPQIYANMTFPLDPVEYAIQSLATAETVKEVMKVVERRTMEGGENVCVEVGGVCVNVSSVLVENVTSGPPE